jgi:hypothetical protein
MVIEIVNLIFRSSERKINSAVLDYCTAHLKNKIKMFNRYLKFIGAQSLIR